MLPKFDESAYQIADPLNPPENLRQATEVQHSKGMGIYQGAIRALQLEGAAFDMTRERFVTTGKQAKAFGAGSKSGNRVSRKYEATSWITKRKLRSMNRRELFWMCRSTRLRQIAALRLTNTADMDEKLKQAEIAANLARATTQDKQNKLDEFRKSLGEYAA
jgi:ribosomal protein L19E